MDHLIETSFPVETRTSRTPLMAKDEENIIRYACGYVCMHLRRRFISSKSEKAVDFIECLDKMREQHNDTMQSTTSFLEYTQEWTKKINRGGLFIISDEAYNFFISLELATRSKLPTHLLKTATCTLSAESTKEEDTTEIVKTICDDEDVLFYWTLTGVDLDEEGSKELLKHIVQLWLTIRGFSLSKEWMEQYKALVKATQKNLRKQLKQRSDD